MKLPGVERAVIEPAKVRDYLLSSGHPVGRFKAAFFRSLGYLESDWPRLLNDLRSMAETFEATPGQDSEYGEKYEVRGTLEGPSGARASVITVWIVLAHEDTPRLVTAYPGAER